ncbi:MAG: PhzF family phenazine biosynthesis protein [Gemmatimonadetes bacterium]|nr:PhzF family phenazine biosynthesis protein [Gemmatimonadota bacterium]
MSTHQFYQLDVFTHTPLAGNPLAVFPFAGEFSDATMQAIAREMNLSETAFVTESDNATRRVRFFTPTAELPLAGHPTIGTWWLLAELGALDLPRNGTVRVTQETGAGVLAVDIRLTDGAPTEVAMTQPLPDFGLPVADRERLGTALGGNGNTVGEGPTAQVVTTALPQLMVPVASLEILQSLPSGGAGAGLAAFLREFSTDCAMCYTMETVDPNATVHCRMFAPGLGVPEDPATGSAAGALASYLVWHGIVPPHDGVGRILVEQGLEIRRPSLIHAEISVGNGGEITQVLVGGQAVTIITGEVTL